MSRATAKQGAQHEGNDQGNDGAVGTSTKKVAHELTLHQSLRESPAQIEALALSSTTGNFLTVDSLAIRVWSSERQLKAYHHLPEGGGEDGAATKPSTKALAACALETADDAFLIIFSPRRKSSSPGGRQRGSVAAGDGQAGRAGC
jgi:hypothetical protein